MDRSPAPLLRSHKAHVCCTNNIPNCIHDAHVADKISSGIPYENCHTPLIENAAIQIGIDVSNTRKVVLNAQPFHERNAVESRKFSGRVRQDA